MEGPAFEPDGPDSAVNDWTHIRLPSRQPIQSFLVTPTRPVNGVRASPRGQPMRVASATLMQYSRGGSCLTAWTTHTGPSRLAPTHSRQLRRVAT